MTVRIRESRVERHNDMLKRRLSKAHRINYVVMADEATSRKLDLLYELLMSYESVYVSELLEQNPAIDCAAAAASRPILNTYRKETSGFCSSRTYICRVHGLENEAASMATISSRS